MALDLLTWIPRTRLRVDHALLTPALGEGFHGVVEGMVLEGVGFVAVLRCPHEEAIENECAVHRQLLVRLFAGRWAGGWWLVAGVGSRCARPVRAHTVTGKV